MVISHKHLYLFIEVPLTGSWAMRHELINHYEGEPILHKHATYLEFRKKFPHWENKFVAFAVVRNPLDCYVSGYFKLKKDHKAAFSNSRASILAEHIDYSDKRVYDFIKKSGASFEELFLQKKIWNRPYSSMIDLDYSYLDHVLRYENLVEDFSYFLRSINLEMARPIPITNKTQGRRADWTSYYTPLMIPKAKKVFGPFMKRWGYEFPAGWGNNEHSLITDVEYRFSIFMKKIYFLHFRYNDRQYARIIRRFNSGLKRWIYE